VTAGRIVVVGADAERRNATAASLRGEGWRSVTAVASVEEGIQALRRGRVACVVIWDDVADVTGVLAARLMVAVEPRLKIVFAASTPDVDLEARARELPIFYYHVAPAGEADLVEAVAAAVGRPRPAAAARRVLIVDDDDAFTLSITMMLESSGYEVFVARSTAEGLATARRVHPDVILVDMVMHSATDGLHFCREARRDPALVHTTIAVVSALSREVALLVPASITAEGDDFLPVDAYFEKPLDLDKFLVELRALLEEASSSWPR
jgi:CheY-like chemotaxis protein